eukprot:15479943-Alexandrium_andersonii.AAC.1
MQKHAFGLEAARRRPKAPNGPSNPHTHTHTKELRGVLVGGAIRLPEKGPSISRSGASTLV